MGVELRATNKTVILRPAGPKDLRFFGLRPQNDVLLLGALRTPAFLLLILTLLVPAPIGFAETNGVSSAGMMVLKPPANLPGLAERISLELRDTNVHDVLKYLSTKSGVNIVTAPGIEGRVTLFLKDVSIQDALQIVLLSNNLAFRQHENILYIMKEEDYVALYGEAYRDQRVLRVIPLKYANPTTVGTLLGNVKSTVGKIIVDEGTGTVVLVDVPEKITVMQDVIQNLDIDTVVRKVPLEVKVFELQYAKAAGIQTEVTKALSPAAQIQVDAQSNTLVISEVKDRMPYVEEVIQTFDRKIRQVFIETKMIQVRLEDRYFMGVQWETLHANKLFDPISGKGDFSISSSATNTGTLSVGSLGKDGYTFLVKALQIFGDTETLAGPQLAVVDGEEANILIGTREAYVTSTVSQAQSTTTTSEDITFIDVGVKLKVKCEVKQDGYVKVTLTPEVSSVGRTLTTANKNSIPIVDTTIASTTVLVKDGYTVLIGGLIKDEISKAVSKIPLLGNLPWIGAAFRNIDDKRVKTELVVLVTPHVISGEEENPFLTASGKEFYPLRKLPSNGPKPKGNDKKDKA